jgi:hypothetical protein
MYIDAVAAFLSSRGGQADLTQVGSAVRRPASLRPLRALLGAHPETFLVSSYEGRAGLGNGWSVMLLQGAASPVCEVGAASSPAAMPTCATWSDGAAAAHAPTPGPYGTPQHSPPPLPPGILAPGEVPSGWEYAPPRESLAAASSSPAATTSTSAAAASAPAEEESGGPVLEDDLQEELRRTERMQLLRYEHQSLKDNRDDEALTQWYKNLHMEDQSLVDRAISDADRGELHAKVQSFVFEVKTKSRGRSKKPDPAPTPPAVPNKKARAAEAREAREAEVQATMKRAEVGHARAAALVDPGSRRNPVVDLDAWSRVETPPGARASAFAAAFDVLGEEAPSDTEADLEAELMQARRPRPPIPFMRLAPSPIAALRCRRTRRLRRRRSRPPRRR